jgi:hypothetical protein
MKGDFTRDTFDKTKRYYRVLMQQGRVQLDADWNEQVSILLSRLETLAADLIGPFGTPAGAPGFSILEQTANGATLVRDFAYSPGRLYVDGMLCENMDETTYSSLGTTPKLESGKTYLVFVDAWEQYVSAAEDTSLRDPALGGMDTTGRSRVDWLVRVAEVDPATTPADFDLHNAANKWDIFVAGVYPQNRGSLKAHVLDTQQASDDPGFAGSSRYRGFENQLYRVEIHTSGAAGTATFKWSRDNGAVAYTVTSIEKEIVKLSGLGRGDNLRIQVNDWVELIDSRLAAQSHPDNLARVVRVDPSKLEVTIKGDLTTHSAAGAAYILRRWDHKPLEGTSGATIPIRESNKSDSGWIPLEDGLEIQFQPASANPPQTYLSGDYWLIPARVATGGIDWPSASGKPQTLPPRGIDHHFAPLAVINLDPSGVVRVKQPDCRAIFLPLLHS